jgi:DNA polymerase III delta prime subunit
MDELAERYSRTENLHHAYVIPGDVEALLKEVRAFATETLKIGIGNPDYYERMFESLGVDEARELKETAYLAPIGPKRIFVLGIPSITREAQNALLKLLEEPPAHVHFFLILPTEELLLPTVRSRTELFRIESESDADDAKKFLGQTPEARLETVKKILDKKDKALAVAFLRNVEKELSKLKQGSAEFEKALEPVIFAETYIRDQGSSAKLLLEYAAISMPKI